MARGTVAPSNGNNTYWFIRPDSGGKDLFCHWTAIIGEANDYKKLTAGDVVEYEIEQGPKGVQAAKVRVVKNGK